MVWPGGFDAELPAFQHYVSSCLIYISTHLRNLVEIHIRFFRPSSLLGVGAGFRSRPFHLTRLSTEEVAHRPRTAVTAWSGGGRPGRPSGC